MSQNAGRGPGVPDIPVVSAADLARPSPATRAAILEGFGRFGLFYVSDHGLDADRLGSFYDLFLATLARDDAVKAACRRPDLWFQRGWTPPNTERAVVAEGRADFKECWFAAVEPADPRLAAEYPELFCENVWPAGGEAFAAAYLEIGRAVHAVGLRVLAACAAALELEPDAFVDVARGGAHVTRALKYLPVEAEALERGVLWGEEHTDFNLVTLLPAGRFHDPSGRPAARPDDGSGLTLRTRPTPDEPRGRRVGGTPPAGAITVQVGQQLEILTGGTFLATPHAITAPREPGWSRVSMAHFVHAHPHAVLQPLAPFDTDETIARYRPPRLAGTFAIKTMADIGLAPASAVDLLGYRHHDRLAELKRRDAQG